MTGFPNEREFTRSAMRFEAEIRAEGSLPVAGKTRDVSLRGLFLKTAERLPMGARCSVRLWLSPEGSPAGIEATGTVVRCDGEGVAVEFEVLDQESYQHIRSLVVLNSPNPEEAEAEIERHVGLQKRSS